MGESMCGGGTPWNGASENIPIQVGNARIRVRTRTVRSQCGIILTKLAEPEFPKRLSAGICMYLGAELLPVRKQFGGRVVLVAMSTRILCGGGHDVEIQFIALVKIEVVALLPGAL